jgi:Fur family transcriptional regulator, ferric uptake regulator
MERQDLKKVGLRATGPRLRILELMQARGQRHLSAEELYKHLVLAGDDVSLATVYRVLTQFEQAGLVVRHNFANGHSVFELAPDEHHDHMVCVETGRLTEFSNTEIERLQQEVARQHGYELVSHSLVLYVRPRQSKKD